MNGDSKLVREVIAIDVYLLKAAGTPMIRPLPLSSLAKFTLLPGVPSTRSTDGMESPTFTMVAVVAWKF